MEFDADLVQLPDLPDHRRTPAEVVRYPVCYTYKKTGGAETVAVCSLLANYLLRRLKYRDQEEGGILGMSEGIMTHYYRDHYAQCGRDHFLPSPDDLNWVIRQWNKVGISFGGIIHCHPVHRKEPSVSDLQYMTMLLTFNPQISSVLLCIVTDGLQFYRFERDFLSHWKEHMKHGAAD